MCCIDPLSFDPVPAVEPLPDPALDPLVGEVEPLPASSAPLPAPVEATEPLDPLLPLTAGGDEPPLQPQSAAANTAQPLDTRERVPIALAKARIGAVYPAHLNGRLTGH